MMVKLATTITIPLDSSASTSAYPSTGELPQSEGRLRCSGILVRFHGAAWTGVIPHAKINETTIAIYTHQGKCRLKIHNGLYATFGNGWGLVDLRGSSVKNLYEWLVIKSKPT